MNGRSIDYFKCKSCDFIQTEPPVWLQEAYNSAIANSDIGLLGRNIASCDSTTVLINKLFHQKGRFLDFGGGYGILTRLMRDRGYDFYRQDEHCTNIFAEKFDINDLQSHEKHFELITAFEVFEHLENPLDEFEKILDKTDSIFFSTLLHNGQPSKNWWYFCFDHGQHVSLYAQKSLELLAKKLALNFYTNGIDLHLFTKKRFSSDPFHPGSNMILTFLVKVLEKILRMIKKDYTAGIGNLTQMGYQRILHEQTSQK